MPNRVLGGFVQEIDDAVLIEMRGTDRRHRGLRIAVDEGGEAERIVESSAPHQGLYVTGIAGVYIIDQPTDSKGMHVLSVLTQRALAAGFADAKLDAREANLPGGGLDYAPLHDAVAVVLKVLENPHG